MVWLVPDTVRARTRWHPTGQSRLKSAIARPRPVQPPLSLAQTRLTGQIIKSKGKQKRIIRAKGLSRILGPPVSIHQPARPWARSPRLVPSLRLFGPPTTATARGSNVMCVCAPASGVGINHGSQLPWSAVTIIAPPTSSSASSTRQARSPPRRLQWRPIQIAGVPYHGGFA